MKPVACGNQVYSTGSLSSPATMSAILFSKPSPLSFENGKLAGSAQTRNAVRSTRSTRCACASETNATTPAPVSSTAVSLTVTEALLLLLFRGLGLVGALGRTATRQSTIGARFQIDVDVLKIATHIGIVAECRHLALLVGTDHLPARSDDQHEVGIAHRLHRLDESRRIARALAVRAMAGVTFGMIAPKARERVPINRAVAGDVVGRV